MPVPASDVFSDLHISHDRAPPVRRQKCFSIIPASCFLYILLRRNGLVQVHLMPIEIGAVYAGEFGFAANGQAAAAAHARAVDHDGVHGYDGLDVVWAWSIPRHALHHRQRADGNDGIVLYAWT